MERARRQFGTYHRSGTWFCSLAAMLFLVAPGRSSDDLVIGMSADFKGKSRGLGIELYRGATAYFEGLNAQGGIEGRKIVIKAYNDNYEPGPAIDNTIELIENDKVLLLFGYVGTATTTRVLPLLKRFEKQDLLLFFPFTGAETVRRLPYEPFVYNLRTSYQRETKALVDFFVENGRKRIAVFYQVDAYGRTGWEGVRNALATHKLKLAGEATYRRNVGFDQSMQAQVDILRDVRPDAIISVGSYGACAAFIRDARDAGWTDVPIANLSFVGSESMLGLLEEAGKKKGKDYTHFLLNSQVVPSYNDDLPAVRDYRHAMDLYNPLPPPAYREGDYHRVPYSFVSLEGYLDAKLLTAILRRVKGPIQRSKLKAAADSIKDLDLGIGSDVKITFERAGSEHEGIQEVYFTVVRRGLFQTLTKEEWKEWRK